MTKKQNIINEIATIMLANAVQIFHSDCRRTIPAAEAGGRIALYVWYYYSYGGPLL